MTMEETCQTDDERGGNSTKSFDVVCYINSCANINLIWLRFSYENIERLS